MSFTVKDFNKKYSDYIADGFYGLAISDEKVIYYLDKIFEELKTIYPSFICYQIKLKFGQAVVYMDNIPQDKIFEMEKNINELLKPNELIK